MVVNEKLVFIQDMTHKALGTDNLLLWNSLLSHEKSTLRIFKNYDIDLI